MRQINKRRILALAYNDWLTELEAKGMTHPDYHSSTYRKKHYKDVAMNLLFCQDGLCAYTEIRLIHTDRCKANHWKDGKYQDELKVAGQIDHFDSTSKKGKGWLWDNLFFVHSDINVKVKGQSEVFKILKPDLDHYDPFELLSYNYTDHIFYVNKNIINIVKRRRVNQMIEVLGLNAGFVEDRRRAKLGRLAERVSLGFEVDFEEERKKLDEFYTAFEMIRRNAAK